MVLHTTTRMGPPDGDAALPVPLEVTEALSMIGDDVPLAVTDGLAKLSHATFNNPMGKEAAGAAGAIQAIVDAMARHVEDGEVLVAGCHALRNAAFHCIPNLSLVREQGGIAAVLTAMERHLENETLNAEGCWALLVFCTNEDENIAVAKRSASIVEQAVARFPENSSIQDQGKFLLALFA